MIITVLGILTTVGLFSWGAYINWSQNKQRGQELSQWKSTFELYKSRFGVYPEPSGGTLPYSYCVGNDLPGDKCGTNGSISENSDLMTQIAKVSSLPANAHPMINNIYVGPYVTYDASNVTLYNVFTGSGSGDCPADTTYGTQVASGVITCKITLTRA